MIRSASLRSLVALAGAATLLVGSTVTASAGTMKAAYNAADAALVPAAYKTVTWQVATDATYPPDESMNGNTMQGFDVDLINAIATTLGVKVKENNVTFDAIIAGMQANRYQIGNSSFTDTKAREKQVNFVDYFKAGEGVYVKATSKLPFTGLTSFCGHSVSVETGTVEQTDAGAVKCTGGKKVTVVAFPTQTLANNAVSDGRADFGFADSQIASYQVATTGGIFKNDGSAVNVAPYGIATQKTVAGAAIAKAIQAAVKTLIANGAYNAILAKYGAQGGELTAAKVVLNGATS